jgi:hypothetical protein
MDEREVDGLRVVMSQQKMVERVVMWKTRSGRIEAEKDRHKNGRKGF